MKLRLVDIFLLMAIVVGLSSCVYDSYDPCAPVAPDTPQFPEDVYLDLSLDVLNPLGAPATRGNAIDDTTYFEPPQSRFEKIKTLRVIIVRGARTTPIEYVTDSAGYIEHNHLFTLNDLGVVQYDDMIFKVRSGEKKRIYFVVNEQFVKDNAGFDFDVLRVNTRYPDSAIEDITMSRNAGMPLIDNSELSGSSYYIPMSERFDIDVAVPEKPEDYMTYHKFFVTRAAVKFSFNVKFASGDYNNTDLYVKRIIVDGLADKEYFLPKETRYTEPVTDPATGLTGRFVESYTTPDDLTQEPFSFSTDLGFSASPVSYIPALYFPESKADTPYYVSVVLGDRTVDNDESIVDKDIILPKQKLPNLPSLPRNTHVVVNMSLTNHSIENVVVTVFPYTAVNLNPEFGFGTGSGQGELDIKNLELKVGDKALLNATFDDDLKDTENKNLIWVTSDINVVTIEPEGAGDEVSLSGQSIVLPYGQRVKLTALKAGEATITVYAQNGQTATCRVVVIPN